MISKWSKSSIYRLYEKLHLITETLRLTIMERRKFIKNIAYTSSVLAIGSSNFQYVKALNLSNEAIDLVYVKNGEPGLLFEKGIEALGGLEKFIKPGNKVTIKPNIGWDAPPERAANTNPDLLSAIVKSCFKAGAKEVFVFDNSCNNVSKCYINSGIEKAVIDAGGTMVNGGDKSKYQKVKIPNAVKLKKAKVHELILQSDVILNVPILKNHSDTGVTVSMKNLMGTVWNRIDWHIKGLHQCIADYASYIKPTLNILDAYRILRTNGPKGRSIKDVEVTKSLFISTDMLAMDVFACSVFGLDPKSIKHFQLAKEKNIGKFNLKEIVVKEIDL
jgi:uncharacterized protein (DUF362 family)